MKILAAMDKGDYSASMINDLARLAANTWADTTLLGVQSAKQSNEPDPSLIETLCQYRQDFFEQLPDGETPYAKQGDAEIVALEKKRWKIFGSNGAGRKPFSLIVRSGDSAREIVAEAREQEIDLVTLGCTRDNECQWHGEPYLPQKIARKAPCSVLVIKEEKRPKEIICFLDQANISQDSLEMISQVVTLHQAELRIIGLVGPKGLRGMDEAETRIGHVVKYYSTLGISTWVKLVHVDDLEDYAQNASRQGMIALWLGPRSFLKKIFYNDLVDTLIKASRSSVLILR